MDLASDPDIQHEAAVLHRMMSAPKDAFPDLAAAAASGPLANSPTPPSTSNPPSAHPSSTVPGQATGHSKSTGAAPPPHFPANGANAPPPPSPPQPTAPAGCPHACASHPKPATAPIPFRHVPLTMSDLTYRTTQATADLLKEIGGGDAIRQITDIFYDKAFEDGSLDKFIHSHNDPHAERLGNWIVEEMGGEGPVWSEERVERNKCPVALTLSNGSQLVVNDRGSAHTAAFWSPKRPEVWMRLMFWSARETGIFDKSPSFESWYVRFIAHFARVYDSSAPAFARDSHRWSADPANIAAYRANGNRMGLEVLDKHGHGVSASVAIAQLPTTEARDELWPYEHAPPSRVRSRPHSAGDRHPYAYQPRTRPYPPRTNLVPKRYQKMAQPGFLALNAHANVMHPFIATSPLAKLPYIFSSKAMDLASDPDIQHEAAVLHRMMSAPKDAFPDLAAAAASGPLANSPTPPSTSNPPSAHPSSTVPGQATGHSKSTGAAPPPHFPANGANAPPPPPSPPQPTAPAGCPHACASHPKPATAPIPFRHVPLTMSDLTYRTTQATADLLKEIGGGDAIRQITDIFYDKAFEDGSLDKFIHSHNDPHAERLGNWIVEEMGGEGPVWSEERVEKNKCPVALTLSNGSQLVVNDRDSSAPAFARDSHRWSADPANIAAYRANGNRMGLEVLDKHGHGVSASVAIAQLPTTEARDELWPYEQ
eukprot:gene2612-30935_t